MKSATRTQRAVTAPNSRVAAVESTSRSLARRRLLVLALNALTIGTLSAIMFFILGYGGWSVPRAGMFAAFVITLPWLSIGLWNALIGVILMARGARRDDPFAIGFDPNAPIRSRTAIVMAIRNEDPERSVRRLRGIFEDLEAHGVADHFDVHLLSDTSDPAIALAEQRPIAAWQATTQRPTQIAYRRRSRTDGYKAGNIREFCTRCRDAYAFFLPLDADSYLSAATVVRLVRMMEDNPRIGILQTLVVGTPAASFFTRVFQFGMRHGMRAYTTGSAWWAGDCGPYWGHNALVRLRPFERFCALPVLPGDGPLGGHVMSHDQVEAVLMRRAGYHVRVIPEEGESWEENPPCLPDFIRRELRWCQGNMQYFQLLGMKGLKAMSRVQLALAILMYIGPPAWIAFIALGVASIFDGIAAGAPPGLGIALLVTVVAMSFAPKLLGVAGILFSGRQSARYGGRVRVVLGALVETVMSVMMAPVVAFAIAVFAAGLLFGKRIDWRAQPRGDRTVGWREAAQAFWPQTLFGLALLAILAAALPSVIPWAAPMIAGLVLAIPFTVATASRAMGRWSVATRICDIPEDPAPPPALARLGTPALAPA